MKRTSLRPVSPKRRAEQAVRRRVLALLAVERGPSCQAGLHGICDGRWTDGHELVRRSQGGSITDPENLLLVCRGCHMWITGHPFEAGQLGLSKWGWERGGGDAA